MSDQAGSPQLRGANGSSIATFGTRLVSVCFHGCYFEWDFVITSITVPIIGADLLCANCQLVDDANHCLINALSFTAFLCKIGSRTVNTH